jgi:hypothetical protein
MICLTVRRKLKIDVYNEETKIYLVRVFDIFHPNSQLVKIILI